MGYETYHQFRIEGDDPSGLTEEEHATAITKLADYTYLFEESCKWYNEEEDMMKYSLLYPKTVFNVTGEGEENGDLWSAFYLNGERQELRPEVIWPEFDKTMFAQE